MEYACVKIEVYVPEEALFALRDALAAAGAGRVGRYEQCASWAPVQGSWRPLPGAQPYDGTIGQMSTGSEYKLEMRCDMAHLDAALDAIRRVHPYEEPLVNVVPLLDKSLF